jgi:hypothetical protein
LSGNISDATWYASAPAKPDANPIQTSMQQQVSLLKSMADAVYFDPKASAAATGKP